MGTQRHTASSCHHHKVCTLTREDLQKLQKQAEKDNKIALAAATQPRSASSSTSTLISSIGERSSPQFQGGSPRLQRPMIKSPMNYARPPRFQVSPRPLTPVRPPPPSIRPNVPLPPPNNSIGNELLADLDEDSI